MAMVYAQPVQVTVWSDKGEESRSKHVPRDLGFGGSLREGEALTKLICDEFAADASVSKVQAVIRDQTWTYLREGYEEMLREESEPLAIPFEIYNDMKARLPDVDRYYRPDSAETV